MAAFTKPSAQELDAFVSSLALGKIATFQPVEGGSVNSNFSLRTSAGRFFLRLYEEQDEAGASAEVARTATLAASGVPTPAAVARGTLAGKPAALFPWVDGIMSCQRGVTPERARALGEALAGVHRAGEGVPASPDRFDESALRKRLERIEPRFPVDRLRAALDATSAARDPSVPRGLVHGDLFRDNVLWAASDSAHLVALLDFESASHGVLAYDLAVCVLSWCYDDDFVPELARALVAGYAASRPLEPAEKRAFYTEAKLAAVRFTITRITDYAMRGGEGRVMKDWRRFLARLDALEAMGADGFAALVGLG